MIRENFEIVVGDPVWVALETLFCFTKSTRLGESLKIFLLRKPISYADGVFLPNFAKRLPYIYHHDAFGCVKRSFRYSAY